MKKNTLLTLLVLLLFLPIGMRAQEYVPLVVSSGFNEDVIAEDSPAADYTTAAVDVQTGAFRVGNNAFVVSGAFSSAGTAGFPASGTFSSVTNSDITFRLGDYDEDNVLLLESGSNETGTLTFQNEVVATKLYVLATGGSGACTFTGTITFTDNTTQAITTKNVADWYNGNPVAYYLNGRIHRGTNQWESAYNNPRVYQIEIGIDAANQTKQIKSVKFVHTTSGTGKFLNVFGVSAEITPDCPKPTNLSVANTTYESTDLHWESLGDSFDVKWGEKGFNTETGGTLEEDFESGETLSGLEAETSYDFYVRRDCGEEDGKSQWAGPFTFYTGYCVVGSTYTGYRIEGFETENGWLNISNMDNGTGNAYNNYSEMKVYQSPGREFDYSVRVPAWTNVEIWIDYNNDFVFDEDELVAEHSNSAYSTTTFTGTIEVPEDMEEGNYRIRVRSRYYYNTTANPCGNMTYGEAEDYTLSVVPLPSCLPVTDLKVDNITSHTADLSWTVENGGDFFDIELVEKGEEPTGTPTNTEVSNHYTIEDLTPATKYEYYVRQNCGEDDGTSLWVGPLSFITLCDYPELSDITGDTICGVGTGNLSAAVAEGSVTQWFAAPVGGTPLAEGSEFITPEVDETTTFYVRSANNLGEQDVKIGTSNTECGTFDTFNPFYEYYSGGQKIQYIYTAEELQEAGLSQGLIESLGFDVVKGNNSKQGFTIYMGKTIQDKAEGAFVDNLQLVYSNESQKMTAASVNTYEFQEPFEWDGVSNLVVQVSWSNNNSYTYTESSIRYHNTNVALCTVASGNNQTPQQLLAITTGATNTKRANTYFNGTALCVSPFEPVEVIVTTPPALTLSEEVIAVCQGNPSEVITIVSGAADYDTFEWMPSAGISGNATTGWTISPQAGSGIYTLRASQSNGDCSIDIPVQVNVSEIGYTALEEEYIACKDDVLELSVVNPKLPELLMSSYGFDNTPVSGFTHNNLKGTTTVARNRDVFTEGNGSIRFSHGNNSTGNLTLTDAIDGTESAGLILEFDHIALLEGGNFDYGYVEYSLDNGSTWTTFNPTQYVGKAYGLEGPDYKRFARGSYDEWTSNQSTQPENDMWKKERFVLNATAGDLSQVKFRFSLKSDGSTNYYGWMIDNVKVYKVTTPSIVWEGDDLYLDKAATEPYADENVQKVYFKQSQIGEYPISATITNEGVGCEATTATIVKVPEVIVPEFIDQIYCGATDVEDLEYDRIEGYEYAWYSSSVSQSALETISTSGKYYFQATSNEGGCMSDRIAVDITIVENLDPVVETEYIFCDQATFNDIQVGTQYGANVEWFATEDSTTVLDPETEMVNGTTYYVRLAIKDCLSEKEAVTVTILETPEPVAEQEFTVCSNTSLSALELEVSNVKWYFNEIGGVPLSGSAILQSHIYYVATFNGVCESDRVPVKINVVQQLDKPTTSTQYFCGSATVEDLVATGGVTGSEYVWYSSATATTPLQPTDALHNGTYYVTQKLSECESARKAVTVKVTNVTAPQAAEFEFCGSAKVQDVALPVISGVTYNWYVPGTATPLEATAELHTGNYYVTKSQNECESEIAIVQITINPRPTSPTGNTTQNFIDSAVLGDLQMNEPNVVWYITYNDALNGINPLPANMPLENEHTYYAVVINENGCPSLPTAVKVVITLGVRDLDLASLKYYPNPVDAELTVSYKEPIRMIEVFDLLGKQIKVQKFEENEVKINVSTLSSGTYLLKVQTDSGSQFVKVVKR